MRPIDADALIKDACNNCDGWCDCVNCDCLNCKSEHRCDFVQQVLEQPTIDAEDVIAEFFKDHNIKMYDELVKALRETDFGYVCEHCEHEDMCRNNDCVIIQAADALEADEKRIAELMPGKGEWIFEKGDGTTCVDGWICTNCKHGFHTNVPYFEGFNYCPNCGAKMKGENDGES